MSGEENLGSMTKIDIHDNDNKMPEQKQIPSPKDVPETLQQFIASKTVHKLRYAFTIPGIFKLIHLILNLIVFVIYSPGKRNSYYFTPGNWLWLATGCGFCITGFLFILYSFSLIKRNSRKIWILDSIYCAIWALTIFVLIFIVYHSEGSLITCILLTISYIIDCYIKCYGWVQKDFSIGEKNIFNSQKPSSPYEVISKSTAGAVSHKSESSSSQLLCPFCPKLNVTRETLRKFFYYIASLAGILKIIEMCLELICFVLLKSSSIRNGYMHYYYITYSSIDALYCLTFAAVSGFCITGILVIFYTLRLIDRERKLTWIIESIYSFVWAIWLLASSIAVAIYVDKHNRENGTLISAATVGFLISLIYIVDSGLKIHGCVKNVTPIGEPKEQESSTATPASV